MKIIVTLNDVENRVPDDWDAAADADDLATWVKGEFAGLDVEDEGISFFVQGPVDVQVVE